MSTPKTSLAYCSGRDRMVRVVWKWDLLGVPAPEGARDDPAHLVCLDQGGECTGSVCPVFQVPSREMELRLVEAGLKEPSVP